ncbi:MAG TPA: outer membrane lipoprotein chaperone LolA [Dokdonella sp.]|uniref:outer membrane lipoprotein chaperone LolA n=1 Tax=Dokdonella sp. TaxID=2291710 RepID=UPI002D17DB93|nr:outer membrane lipoprotein chaperone LolA [Dokdonella sp.]HOX71465.1 outer membrane lipoprotein chaperone LolA [Dokdonella sp.]HPG94774.1 outer membrane lipoprotein chaperone LolA [Dokdonella sp.]HPN79273.1 outer membrane lipoprotein chaperone LolA [Dokdonella sp.]
MLRAMLLLASLIALNAHAAATARSRLEAFSSGITTISARFEQSVTGAKGSRGEASTGTLALKAPRQFRWQTITPYQQLIVADGNRVWIHDPDLEQVSVRSQGAEEAHSPLAVLTDLGRLDHEFSASEAGEREGLQWLKLVSKVKEPEFAFAELGFDAGGLARMRFEDSLGNTTEIRFSDWKREPRLAADTFSFTPPEGVDVVGDPGEDAEVFPIHD